PHARVTSPVASALDIHAALGLQMVSAVREPETLDLDLTGGQGEAGVGRRKLAGARPKLLEQVCGPYVQAAQPWPAHTYCAAAFEGAQQVLSADTPSCQCELSCCGTGKAIL